MHTAADEAYIEELVPQRVRKHFAQRAKNVAQGKVKRTTLPNNAALFDPLNGIKDRLEAVSQSPITQIVESIISEDD